MPRLNQNLSDVDEEDMTERSGWRALPDGEYACQIIESDYKKTQAGDGMVLKLKFEVTEPGFEGRFFYDNLTLEHPKSDTVRIARANLKQLAVAVGHPDPDFIKDSEDLHGLTLVAKLQCVRNPQFGDADGNQNKVMSYRSIKQPAKTAAKPKAAPPARSGKSAPKGDEIPF